MHRTRERNCGRAELRPSGVAAERGVPPGSAGGDLLEFGDELTHRPERQPGDRPVGVAHDTVAVEDEDAAAGEPDRTEGAVHARHRLVGVGQQRELESVLGREGVVAAHVLRRDPQYLGVHLVELPEVVVVAVELLRAHRRVVTRIEHEHHGLAGEVRQRVLATARSGQREVGGDIAHTQAHEAATSINSSLMSKLANTSCTSSLSSNASRMRRTDFASPASVIGTRLSDTIGESAESTSMPASSRAAFTSYTTDGSVITR